MLGFNRKVNLVNLKFDELCLQGQIRPLNAELVQRKKQEFMSAPPLCPVRDILLWQTDATATSFVVLGGQHTIKVLKEIREERQAESRALPDWLQFAYGNVVSPECPVDVRRKLAGDHQFRQRQVESVRLSRWAWALLNTDPAAPLVDRIKEATLVTGWKRYAEDKMYVKEYAGLAKWVLEVDQAAVRCLEKIEELKADVTPSNLRWLQHLISPEARRRLLPSSRRAS